MQPQAIENRDLALQSRLMPMSSVDVKARTVEATWTTGSPVRRYDYMRDRYYNETLSLDASSVRMQRFSSGNTPVLNAHSGYGLESVLGVVERASLNPAVATMRFSKRADVEPIFQDVEDRILRSVSVGYRVFRYEMIAPINGTGDWEYRAVDWEPIELSLVPIPADAGATVRSLDKQHLTPCEFFLVSNPAAAADLPSNTTTTERSHPMTTPSGQTTAPAAQPDAGTLNAEQVRNEAIAFERARVSEISTRCDTLGLAVAFRDGLITTGATLDAAFRAIVDEVARKQAPTPVATRAEVIEDERVKVRAAVSDALAHRANPRAPLANNGASEFRYMSLTRMAEEVLTREGVRTRGMSAMEIATRSLHATSDFANILLDAANKRLRQAYAENVPSYTRWARRAANAPDFKTINVTQLSNAPDLLPVLDGGEITSGSMTDGRETYSVITYGRIIPISRQAIVNDDLNAFDRVPTAMGMAARRLENRTVYGILAGSGVMSDTGALFNNTAVATAGGHANFATGTGAALGTGSLITARAGIRVQRGFQSEELNLAPSYLIVPAALEQAAYQFTSNQFVPASSTGINEFRQGGRTALEPIVEAFLDGTVSGTVSWYLACDSGQIDTIEYCYLDGNEGLYLESQIGFEVDGIKLKGRLDFATTAIDWRGMYKSRGS